MYRLAKDKASGTSFLPKSYQGLSIFDHNSLQIRLLYWVTFYDMVYDLPANERPTEYVIKDDEALDIFWENLKQRHEHEAKGQTTKEKSRSKPGAKVITQFRQ